MKKVDKEFVLSDSSVNCYGFRLLTSGYQLSEFAKNPIGYYMHQRDNGVLVKWEDLKIEGDKVIGKPSINLSNARGQQTVDEINSGFLNAASLGNIVVLETSTDATLMLPGQTQPTITKWYNRECSLVDVPGNTSALVLYDLAGHVVNLAQLGKKIEKAKPIANSKDIRSLLASSIMDKDITEETAQALEDRFKNDDSLNPVEDLRNLLKEFAQMRIDNLMAMPWDEFDKSGLGEEFARKYLTGYKLKRYLQFGKQSNGLIDNTAFLKFAVDNGYIAADFPTWNFEETASNTKEVIFNKIYNHVEQSTKYLIDSDWDNLSLDQLSRLKEEAFSAYKQKYMSKFGIEYKDNNSK